MRVLFVLLFLLATPTWAAPAKTDKGAPKKIYCWEEKGQKLCGDVLPATAVEQARTERSAKTGTVTREVARPPTAEELAVEKSLQDALSQQSDAQKQAQRRTDILLSTYPTETELLQSFADREKELVSAVNSMKKSQKDLHKDLADKLQILGNVELGGKTPTAKQMEAMQNARKQFLLSSASIKTLENDLIALKKERDATHEIYRQAKLQNQSL